MFENETSDNMLYRSILYYTTMGISSLSFIPYILLLLVFIKTRKSLDIISMINFQLIASSMLNSITFILPRNANNDINDPICKVQTFLNTFSDLNTTFIVLSIAMLSFYHFKYQNFIDSNKFLVYFSIGIICWGIPLACSLVSLTQVAIDFHGLCWVKGETIGAYIVYGLVFLIYIINVIMLILLRKKIKEFLKQENAFILYHKFFKRINRYIILLAVNFCIMIFNLVTIISVKKERGIGEMICTFITDILEALLCPTFVMVYGFNNERWREIKRWFTCQSEASKIKEEIQKKDNDDLFQALSPPEMYERANSLTMMDSLGYS